jgi:quercetin dioxygenase-like cupin family protein
MRDDQAVRPVLAHFVGREKAALEAAQLRGRSRSSELRAKKRAYYEEQNTNVDSAMSHDRRGGGSGAKGTPIMLKDLTDAPGKEALMIIVEYPPGGADLIHIHNAHGFIYALESSVVMQVMGGKQVTLKRGQTFYEGPDDAHTVGRNASSTEPAKFLVFLVKEKGAPILTPVE